MEREILDLLILARAYLEFGWCQGDRARDAKGPCHDHDPKAVRWCIMGALGLALQEVDQRRVLEVSDGVQRLLFAEARSLAYYNDTHRREDVLALIDRACARLGKG